jgi:hypothetical protein
MSITRKLAIPAAGIATAAIAQGTAAAAATVPHHSGVLTPKQATAPRVVAVHILDHDPLGHDHLGVRPETASRSHSANDARINFYIKGKGNEVDYWSAIACTNKTYSKAHIEIEDPGGGAWDNTGTFDFKAGDCLSASSSPYVSYKGRWHAILWNHNASGGYKDVVSTYINVG